MNEVNGFGTNGLMPYRKEKNDGRAFLWDKHGTGGTHIKFWVSG